MTTVLAIFLIAFALSLSFTPLAGRLGKKLGAIDLPNERKVHAGRIPRTGGVVIFSVFLISLICGRFLMTDVSSLLIIDRQIIFFLCGGVLCFGIGLFDDFHRLGPRIKFLFQVIAASLAFFGGFHVEAFSFFNIYFHFGPFSYLLTVFWFLLFINAINLMDGLDGLVGGIVFFASVVMILLSVLRSDFLTAMFFAALAGSVMGFLRYNFNPASIFLGDGGSYFLGYTIAGLSIMGSIKSQVGAAVLIPLLALGIPLFDTFLSPLRRFIRGRKMFHPDSGHIHHKLMENGLSTKKAVLFIYTITICLCLLAIMMVNIRDERAGLILIIIGAGSVIFIRKLGYFEYIASDKIFGWLKDLSDEAGLRRDRRSFLDLQIDTGKSKNLEELWQNTTRALEMLEFDDAALYLNYITKRELTKTQPQTNRNPHQPDRRKTSSLTASVTKREKPPEFRWARQPLVMEDVINSRCFLRLELPLLSSGDTNFGNLLLLKDLRTEAMNPYVLRRVEQLRRTIIGALETINNDSVIPLYLAQKNKNSANQKTIDPAGKIKKSA